MRESAVDFTMPFMNLGTFRTLLQQCIDLVHVGLLMGFYHGMLSSHIYNFVFVNFKFIYNKSFSTVVVILLAFVIMNKVGNFCNYANDDSTVFSLSFLIKA